MWTDAVRVCRPHAAGERLVDRMILQHCARFGLGVRGARTCGMQAEPCSVISRRISQFEDASEARSDVHFLSTWYHGSVGSCVEYRSSTTRSHNQYLKFSNQGHAAWTATSTHGSRLNHSIRLPNAGRRRSTVATLSQILRQRWYVSGAAVTETEHLSCAALAGNVAADPASLR